MCNNHCIFSSHQIMLRKKQKILTNFRIITCTIRLADQNSEKTHYFVNGISKVNNDSIIYVFFSFSLLWNRFFVSVYCRNKMLSHIHIWTHTYKIHQFFETLSNLPKKEKKIIPSKNNNIEIKIIIIMIKKEREYVAKNRWNWNYIWE